MRQIQMTVFGIPEEEVRFQGSYRPRISGHQLGQLWALKQRTGRPITELVAEAIDQYLKRLAKKGGDDVCPCNRHPTRGEARASLKPLVET